MLSVLETWPTSYTLAWDRKDTTNCQEFHLKKQTHTWFSNQPKATPAITCRHHFSCTHTDVLTLNMGYKTTDCSKHQWLATKPKSAQLSPDDSGWRKSGRENKREREERERERQREMWREAIGFVGPQWGHRSGQWEANEEGIQRVDGSVN